MPSASVGLNEAGEKVPAQTDLYAQQQVGLWPSVANPSDEPIPWAWLSGLVVLGALLRAVALNQQLWFDEIVTLLDSASLPLSRIITHYNSQNQHMLYSILARGSIHLFGEHPWSLRVPAVLFGVAAIPALYFFGRLITTSREALSASALMTVNYQHIWFSQNARGYTGMVFWSLIASIFFIASTTSAKTRDWILYGVAAALGVYTHLTTIFIIVGHAVAYVWLVTSRVKSERRFPRNFLVPLYGFALSAAMSLLLYAPIISRVFARTIAVAGQSPRSDWSSPVWAIAETVRGLRAGMGGGLIAVLLAGAIVLSGLISYWRENRFVVAVIVFPALATAVAVLATSHNLWPRFFFFEIGFALLFIVRGATGLGRFAKLVLGGTERLALRLSICVVALMLLGSIPPLRAEYLYPKQDYLGAMSFVESQKRAEDQIVTVGIVSIPYQRYYGRDWPLVETAMQLSSVLKAGHSTWLIYSMPIAVRANYPDVWKAMGVEFRTVRVFPGTLAGGEIYVCKSTGHEDFDKGMQ